MRSKNFLAATGATMTLALALTACGGDDSSGGGEGTLEGASITVGSKDFDEQLILGNISKLALENAGADVTDQINLGGTDAARAALTSGEIDTYWEYNGTAWISFFKETKPIPDRIEQYEAVAERDKKQNNLVWLSPAEFNNTYGLAYPTEAADELGNPETISDLGELLKSDPSAASVCVESEFSTRDDGLPGMEKAYGFEVPNNQVTVLDTALVYTAADKQDPCNFGEVFTSDGRIAALDLTVLEDDEGFFPLYNPSPVFTQDIYDEYGDALDEIFDPIAEALTQDAMNGMNEEVSVNLLQPEKVAEDWLNENGLL
ncbi:glycine betaine ABC transporter substrate-binding protein [Nocardioides donggukensis]|uniref:Glycine betaine ABC transporter substrate-binding protein n=1 Tax=Nocardioides donggukensis TaxID=2774019 RepID=A0A927K5Z8_9ACTN|nr:glycine betaine ABC transporter substrate-binding protein [Nocardioides donggukensis]MBD8870453.1 glycine betaine ABC transporter substrate-binding protein [Nocardioides donggukensis]